ncbi:MAG TPA: tetratricopeptide repeat protein, partial [Fodinibius sp.]|nr:tetratricopeptide repeat protein [Fodinibius sp.]
DNFVKLGEFVKGEELLNEAIDLHESSNLNSVERTYINNLSRLGLVYLRTGRDEKAKAAYLKALEASRNAFGPKSQLAVDIYVNLGLVYRDIGQYLKSREYYNTALTLADSSQKQTIALSIGNLADAYRDQGMFEEAINLHKRSLELNHQILDSPHPTLASAYNSLAFTYQQSGQYQKADSLHQIALSMRRTLFPPDHHHIASSLIRLGLLKIKQLLPREAEQYLTEGYDILSRKLPENHWQIIGARGGLAVSRAMQGEFESNLPIVEEAYQKYMEKFGPDDWRTREAAGALAGLYQIWGKTEKANYYSQRQ